MDYEGRLQNRLRTQDSRGAERAGYAEKYLFSQGQQEKTRGCHHKDYILEVHIFLVTKGKFIQLTSMEDVSQASKYWEKKNSTFLLS